MIQGGPDREKIVGRGGEDVICAGRGEDVIDGGMDRDVLAGEGANDLFYAQPPGLLAEDIVDGGPSHGSGDRADYSESPLGIHLNLSNRTVQLDPVGAATPGRIVRTEDVAGTDLDDELIGDEKDTKIRGLEGDDFIDGRGGGGNLLGDGGTDTLSFVRADAKVALNANHERAFIGDDPAAEISEFEIYLGSRFNDRIIGSKLSEDLVGGRGEDRLRGLGEGDTLEGGEDDDTIFPGEGDDLVDGGPNDPVRSTGAHGDLVSYEPDTAARAPGSASSFDFEAYLTTQPVTGPPAAFGVGEDPLVGIESIRAPKTGMSYLEGDDGPNVLIGGSKIDLIDGLGGNDLLFGLAANDSLEGGDGDDYLDGGKPSGETETDSLDGGEGDDTCLDAREDYFDNCETIG